MAGKKVLHIDDDPTLLLLVRTMLTEAGYQVTSATDGMQGIMMTRQQQPDIIILDVMLPAGGGQGVYDRLRMMQTTSHIPILIYTGMGKDDVLKKFKIGPRTSLVQKPASQDDFLEAVYNLLTAP